jgi:imidazole glycerol-phosphate synthase subunit HisH
VALLTIVDYGVGNLASIQNMLKKAGIEAIISGKPEDISVATKLLLPGMGHFDNCMEKFSSSGLQPLIEQKVLNEKVPVLGICVGLQMFMRSSEEGKLPGLGWINGDTIRFKTNKMPSTLKVPNMGWLEINITKTSKLTQGLEQSRFYFAHSYHVQLDEMKPQLITAHYGYEYTVGIEWNNIVGVQFHPEKSHRFGMQLLKNFATNY